MLKEALVYALKGSVSKAGAWAALPGMIVVWLCLLFFGRRDVVLPTTFPGAIELFVVCAVAAWVLIVVGRFVYAPYSFLKLARSGLSELRKTERILEITFDPAGADYVEQKMGLHGANGEFFSVGVRNGGTRTLDDVTLRALPSWFTREAIATAQMRQGNGPVELIELAALHPSSEEIVQCFGLSYAQPATAPEYIFNQVQRFTLETTARDTPSVRRDFEYDPNRRPMLRMLP